MNGDALDAQRRYGRWLLVTTRLGAVLLVVAFVLYVTGAVSPHVPIERLPKLWKLPASQFLEQAHIAPGWHGWTTLIAHGDMLVQAAIALLISSSILCLAAVVPLFWKRGERMIAVLCVLQIAVLVFAASGALV